MTIDTILLNNYRNYKKQLVAFDKGINVIIGNNAQGKTNLLEAVFLCAIGKSPKTNKDKDLVNWGESLGKVTLQYSKNSGNKSIEVYLSTTTNKTIKINRVPIKRIGELMGEFNAVYFSPDEMKLVKESPDERRRFLDMSLSQFDRHYFYSLNKYNKILSQRNKLLKTQGNQETIKQTISIWNEQLATVARYIIEKRLNLIEKLKVLANNALQYLTDNKEQLELNYQTVKFTELDGLKDNLIAMYESSLPKDMKLGYTTVGLHRDDFSIVVNNIDIRHFGSQGQQRTCALALKLAELEVFKEHIGEYPVLLLDDVLSELDNSRQLKLLSRIKNLQTIITGTHFNFDVPHQQLLVVNGKLTANNKK